MLGVGRSKYRMRLNELLKKTTQVYDTPLKFTATKSDPKYYMKDVLLTKYWEIFRN